MIQGPLPRRVRQAGLVALAAPLGAAIFFGSLQLTGNFNAVVPGKLYRSAQLTPGRMPQYVEAYKIRTIIDLRGQNKGQPWYDAEVKESDRLKIAYIDFGMSARHELAQAQAITLIGLMKKSQKADLDPLQGRCGSFGAGLGTLSSFGEKHRSSGGGAAVVRFWAHFVAVSSRIRDGAHVRALETGPPADRRAAQPGMTRSELGKRHRGIPAEEHRDRST